MHKSSRKRQRYFLTENLRQKRQQKATFRFGTCYNTITEEQHYRKKMFPFVLTGLL